MFMGRCLKFLLMRRGVMAVECDFSRGGRQRKNSGQVNEA